MKDHEINNIIKIHIIDSTDNEKSCCYQFLLTDQYQSKSDFRQTISVKCRLWNIVFTKANKYVTTIDPLLSNPKNNSPESVHSLHLNTLPLLTIIDVSILVL